MSGSDPVGETISGHNICHALPNLVHQFLTFQEILVACRWSNAEDYAGELLNDAPLQTERTELP